MNVDPVTSPLRVDVRWMIRRDMPEVLDVEGDSFKFPWLEEDFIRCLRQRDCSGRAFK
jgi:ribosomal-protein-alanine N-acetyltransferase